jgi:hypothetical protein
MRRLFLLFALLLAAPAAHAAAQAAAPGDTRQPSADELHDLFSIVCPQYQPDTNAADPAHSYLCADVRLHSSMTSHDAFSPPAVITITSVAYGDFTGGGQQEAYLSYSSGDLDNDAARDGGGILYWMSEGGWEMIHWYDAGQWDHCLAVPGPDKTRMLCVESQEQMAGTYSWVKLSWIGTVPAPTASSDEDDTERNRPSVADTPGGAFVVTGVDSRANDPGFSCTWSKGKAMLLSVDDLTRATTPGVFATSHVTYASAADIAAACKAGDFSKVKLSQGEIRYVLNGTRLRVQVPAPFAPIPGF